MSRVDFEKLIPLNLVKTATGNNENCNMRLLLIMRSNIEKCNFPLKWIIKPDMHCASTGTGIRQISFLFCVFG